MSGNIPAIDVGNANLLLLAEILEVADENHIKRGERTYDQCVWEHPCGTPACAIGHWNHYKRRPLNMNTAREKLCENEFAIVPGSSAWAHLFGYKPGYPKTAKESAARIRAFVAQRSQSAKDSKHG